MSAKTPTSKRQRSPFAKPIPELRVIFTKIDTNKNQLIDVDELMSVLNTYDSTPIEDVIKLIQEADTDEDGQISFEEFIDIMDKAAEHGGTSKQWRKAYDIITETIVISKPAASGAGSLLDKKDETPKETVSEAMMKRRLIKEAMTKDHKEALNSWIRRDADPSVEVVEFLFDSDKYMAAYNACTFGWTGLLALFLSFPPVYIGLIYWPYFFIRLWWTYPGPSPIPKDDIMFFLSLPDVSALATYTDYMQHPVMQQRRRTKRIRSLMVSLFGELGGSLCDIIFG